MINLDRIEIDTECPRCRFHNPVWLRQVRLRDVVICRGCKANIQLDDYLNTYRNAQRQLEKQLQELEKSLRSLGKISINIRL